MSRGASEQQLASRKSRGEFHESCACDAIAPPFADGLGFDLTAYALIQLLTDRVPLFFWSASSTSSVNKPRRMTRRMYRHTLDAKKK
jgi:hypothetical protein